MAKITAIRYRRLRSFGNFEHIAVEAEISLDPELGRWPALCTGFRSVVSFVDDMADLTVKRITLEEKVKLIEAQLAQMKANPEYYTGLESAEGEANDIIKTTETRLKEARGELMKVLSELGGVDE